MSDIYGAPVSLARVHDDRRRLLTVQADAPADAINLDSISSRLRASRQTA